jgi:hypothetical protein
MVLREVREGLMRIFPIAEEYLLVRSLNIKSV